MTIIGIPSFGKGGLNSNLNPRFGRCSAFTFVTVEDGDIKEVKTVPNGASNAMGGAGIQAAQTIGNNGATAVIIGALGPNASQALSSLNVDIYQAPGQQVTVKEAVEMYINGELQKIAGANVGSHYGMGGGVGGGRGGGMGGGGGGGMGRRRNL